MLLHTRDPSPLFARLLTASSTLPLPRSSHIQGPPPKVAAPANLPNTPPEALRFFHIDHSWLDAFIDGALSCASHLEPDFDRTRLRIKLYLSGPIQGLTDVCPPVPRSGFVIRSSVVKAMPGLKISATTRFLDPVDHTWKEKPSNPKTDPKSDPIVKLSKMDDYTILCLFDCLLESTLSRWRSRRINNGTLSAMR